MEYNFSRRKFLGIVPVFALVQNPILAEDQKAEKSGDHRLKEALGDEESVLLSRSKMARDLANFFGRGKGYSCAESIFMTGLRFLDKPEESVWFSAGFGGGLKHRDLCGFLTGGIMIIGASAGELKEGTRVEKQKWCGNLVKEYWKWWKSIAPLHCSEIRTKKTGSGVCKRLGTLACARVEALIQNT